MNFIKTEQQLMISDMVQKFAKEHMYPYIMEWDEQQIFPKSTLQQLGSLGLMGILVPEMYGGSGLQYADYVTALTEIGSVCGSVGLSVAAHNSLCTGHILQFGNDAQKKNLSA